MNVDGNRERVDALRVNAIRVDENQCKEKERKKRLTWLDASAWAHWRAETDWMQMTVKTRKKKRKEKKERKTYQIPCTRMVVDAGGTRMGSSGAVDDSARVSLNLEIFVQVCAATHY